MTAVRERPITTTTEQKFPDFEAFRIQRERVQEQANKVIAEHIATMIKTLADIKTIAEAAEVKVNFYQLSNHMDSASSEIGQIVWASSSDDC